MVLGSGRFLGICREFDGDRLALAALVNRERPVAISGVVEYFV